MIRYARVTGGLCATLSTVRDYLPVNYSAELDADGNILISGEDDHGWSLDGYVIPRLDSALIAASEFFPK